MMKRILEKNPITHSILPYPDGSDPGDQQSGANPAKCDLAAAALQFDSRDDPLPSFMAHLSEHTPGRHPFLFHYPLRVDLWALL